MHILKQSLHFTFLEGIFLMIEWNLKFFFTKKRPLNSELRSR